MLRKTRSFTSIALISAIVGCAAPVPIEVKMPDAAQISLEKALIDVDDAPPHSVSADAPAVPAKLAEERITIRSYVGDASNLLKRFSKARNMVFRITGPEPHLPLLITVDVESASLEDLLSQINFQFGQRANLVLGDDRIEIRYRGQAQ